MTVEEIERADPTRFLDAGGQYRETVFGSRMKIMGQVKNTATVAKFKDIVIKVIFYSRTNSIISTDNYMLYEFVPASSTVKFEWKIDKPKACTSLGWEVVSATPY